MCQCCRKTFSCFAGNYILSYLWQRPKGASYVTQALVQLFARLTKLGWFDSDKEDFVFRNVIRQVQSFLQGSVEYCMVGVQLLSQLTCEMNHVTEVSMELLPSFSVGSVPSLSGGSKSQLDQAEEDCLLFSGQPAL